MSEDGGAAMLPGGTAVGHCRLGRHSAGLLLEER